MRRTKIVATLGPRSRQPETLGPMLEAGADVVRLNFAHATAEMHQQAAAGVRKEAQRLGRSVGVLVDLPGPKMRTGMIQGDEVELEAGHQFLLSGEKVVGGTAGVSTSIDNLTEIVAVGDDIYLADGEIVLEVVGVDGGEVRTEVVRGGVLRSRKGMHLPQAERQMEAFTPEDQAALAVCLGLQADLIGLSFVRDAEDIRRGRAALSSVDWQPLLVAKIETRSATENLTEIVAEADAVMVARGDLGIQMPLRRVPILQKEIITACNEAGKPVITATQMLESMTRAPLPTRAEVADVVNATLDGTDALMLSEETAVGDHPVAAVETMASIAETADALAALHPPPARSHRGGDRISWAVAHAAVEAAHDLQLRSILCPTRSGATARRVAAFRPGMPIIGLSPRAETLGALMLSWGVTPLLMPEADDAPSEVRLAVAAARNAKLIDPGDLVAVIAGTPSLRPGGINLVEIVSA